RRTRPNRVALLLAAALLIASAAMALGGGALRRGSNANVARPGIGPACSAFLSAPSSTRGEETAADLPAAPPTATARTPAARATTAPSASAPVEPGTDTSAAALFAQANAERRRGAIAAAVDAYGVLQRRFPTSSEAMLSHVLLGRL